MLLQGGEERRQAILRLIGARADFAFNAFAGKADVHVDGVRIIKAVLTRMVEILKGDAHVRKAAGVATFEGHLEGEVELAEDASDDLIGGLGYGFYEEAVIGRISA